MELVHRMQLSEPFGYTGLQPSRKSPLKKSVGRETDVLARYCRRAAALTGWRHICWFQGIFPQGHSNTLGVTFLGSTAFGGAISCPGAMQ